nr:hypothetical protein [Tanacetum cinerariifolium]
KSNEVDGLVLVIWLWSKGKGLLGPIGGSCGGKGGSCGSSGGRRGSMAERGGGWFAKRLMDSKEGLGGRGFVVLGGKSSRESKNAYGEEGGVEKMSSTESKFMVKRDECFEGEIPRVMIGESGGETFGVDGGAVW